MTKSIYIIGFAALLFITTLLILWARHNENQDYDTGHGYQTPSNMIMALAFATALGLWITCCGARTPGGRAGGGSEGSDRVHRVYPPGVIALGAILPTLMMTAIGGVYGGVLGFFVGFALGASFAFATLLYLLSSPEYSAGLIDL